MATGEQAHEAGSDPVPLNETLHVQDKILVLYLRVVVQSNYYEEL